MRFRWMAVLAFGGVLRALPPWYRLRLYSKISGDPFEHGVFDREVTRRVRPHGYSLDLDMRDWMERFAAIGGIFYEIEATAVLQSFLKRGAAFLDIGGNIGFLSLTAASIVGSGGKVIYVEPNEKLLSRFRQTLLQNGITNVEAIQAAVGEREGEAALNIGLHHGISQVVDGVGIRVIVGDVFLAELEVGIPLLVKIDIEGFEEKALRGMPLMRARPNTSFLVEITDTWLRDLGGSAETLFKIMTEDGYDAFLPHVRMSGVLELSKIEGPLDRHQYDVVFARKTSG